MTMDRLSQILATDLHILRTCATVAKPFSELGDLIRISLDRYVSIIRTLTYATRFCRVFANTESSVGCDQITL